MAKKLTPLEVANLKPRAARYEVPDGNTGLRCVVQPSGARGWCVRFRRPDKRPAKLTLDSTLSLAAARAAAAAALHEVATGKDPAALKREAKAAAASTAAALAADTVELHAQQFLERYARKRTRPSSWKQTEHILEDVVLPAWRGRTIHDIKRRDVIALVEAVAEGRPILANRTLRVLSKWFNWLAGRDMVLVSPCTGVERPSKEIARDRILSDDEIKRLWSACDVLDDRTAACVRLMLLLGQRRNEIAHMHWSEITGNVWTLAPARTKNNRQHTVPLPRQALDIIEALPRVGDYVLRPLGNRGHAKRAIDAVMKPATRWVFHDLRRTAASGMSRLGARTEAVERALNHVSGAFGGITGVYQRDDLADAKRDALRAWADHVEAVVSGEPAGKVVKLRA